MAHLSNFGVGNFRSFKEVYDFEFRPITILTGTNSSGKSSLIKALLFLKGPFAKIKTEQDLNNPSKNYLILNSVEEIDFEPELNIGNFQTVKNRKTSSDILTFELPFIFPSTIRKLTLILSYVQKDTPIKNVELKSLKIVDNDSLEELLVYNSIPGEVRIKFSSLWKLFREGSDIILKRKELNEEIKKLKEENNYSESDPNVFDEKVKSQIDKLKLERSNLPFEQRTQLGNCFNEGKSMYFSVGHILRPFTLLNYLFIWKINWLAEKIEILFPNKSEDQRLDILNEIKVIQEKILSTLELEEDNLSISEFILREELRFLDKQVFEFPYRDWEGEVSLVHILPLVLDLFAKAPLEDDEFISQDSMKLIRHRERSNFLKKMRSADTPIKEYLEGQDIILNQKYLEQVFGAGWGGAMEVFVDGLFYEGFIGMFKVLNDIFTNIEFIPSVRTKIDRFYRLGGNESVLHDLLFQFQKLHLTSAAASFLNTYVKEFGIADCVKIEIEKDSSGSRILFYKGDHEQELADFGYGISQILPILLKIALVIQKHQSSPEMGQYEASPSLLIIEEPETNLHPALQSKLADLFVKCYQSYNIQLIIETHSEYLIRKLQYIIADQKSRKVSFPAQDAIIYYFNDPDKLNPGESYIKKINFNRDGTLSQEFGTGFFDEADNLSISLFNLNKSQKN